MADEKLAASRGFDIGAIATKKGYQAYEVMSALQKEIRRGKEEEAMYWAMELIESGLSNILFSRLRVIAHEDVGTGSPLNFLFALRALDDAMEWKRKNNEAFLLGISNCILSLCRASKSRDGDNFQAYIRNRRLKEKLDIPDYALDKHTLRGKMMGRGIEHFILEGSKLEPDHSTEKYIPGAAEFWKKRASKGETKESEIDEGNQITLG